MSLIRRNIYFDTHEQAVKYTNANNIDNQKIFKVDHNFIAQSDGDWAVTIVVD